MLADLAEVVRDFTEPRRHTEIIETRQLAVSRTGRTRSRLVRSQYVTVFPPLLGALHRAVYPSSADMGPSGAFESQPAANLSAVSVLMEIAVDIRWWVHPRRLNVRAATETGRMRGLVSGVTHHPQHLDHLIEDARRWRQDALMVTGEEEPSRVINQPCPMCGVHNALVMRADGSHVSCRRCLTVWGETQVGLLAVMLANNRTHETLAVS